MKRSTGWIAIAGVAVELATYAIASWVMGLPEPKAFVRPRKQRRIVYKRVVEPAPAYAYAQPQPDPEHTPPVPAPEVVAPRASAPAPAPPPAASPAPVAATPVTYAESIPPEPPLPPAPPPPAVRETPLHLPPTSSEAGQVFEPLPWQRMRPEAEPVPVAPPPPRTAAPVEAPGLAAEPPPFVVKSPVAAPTPRFVAPPVSEIPQYLLDGAERTAQFHRAYTKAGWVALGFYPDGSVRIVDTDGGQYVGYATSARAAMKESGGGRSFEIGIGVSAEQRLQTAFVGGIHDGENVILETVASPAGLQ